MITVAFQDKRGKVVIRGREVIKQFNMKDLQDEYDKSILMRRCAEKNGFLAPQPTSMDKITGTINYEYIPDLCSIREVYLKALRDSELSETELGYFVRSGEVLAYLHRDMVLTHESTWKPSKTVSQASEGIGLKDICTSLNETPTCLLHGDYGFSNVFTQKGERAVGVVVIDASPNYFVTYAPQERGSIYIDLANFVSNLDGMVPVHLYPGLNWRRVPAVKDAFLQGYEHISGFALDRELLSLMARVTAFCYYSSKYGKSLKRRIAMWVLYNHLKRNK